MSDAATVGVAPLPDGGSVAFEVRGRAHRGTPLLLIRPLGGSMALWGGFGERLAEHHRVVAFDPRGAGHSSAAHLGVSTRAMADDAVRLLDHLGIARAHVFGISLGGMTAQRLVLDAPGRVERLCLASTAARGLEFLHAGLRRGLGFAKSGLEPRERVEASLVRRVLSARFRRRHPAAVDLIERPLVADPARRIELLKHAAAGARHDARAELEQIRAPTLVLAGECDTLLGRAPQENLARMIRGATFEVVAGAGHDLTLEKPVETADRLLRFLAET